MRYSRFIVLIALTALPSAAQTIQPHSNFADFGSPTLSSDGKTLAFEWFRLSVPWNIYTRPLAGGKPVPFIGGDPDTGLPTSPRWSPDNKQIAYLREYCASCSHRLFVMDYPRGIEHKLGEVCGSLPSWTPDGHHIIATVPVKSNEDCRIALIPIDGGRRVRLAAENSEIVAIAPDGKHLAYSVWNQVKLVSLTADFHFAGTPVTLAKEPHPISSINWVPDGRGLYFQIWEGTIKSISIEAIRASPHLIDLKGNIEISQILADGSVLGIQRGQGSALWRIDLQASTAEPRKVRNIPWTDRDLAVSPDGQRLAFLTNRKGLAQIWISRLDGSAARVIVPAIQPFDAYGDKTAVDGISWSPDGKWIAFLTEPGVGHGDEDAKLFLVPSTGGHIRVLVDLCSQMPGGRPLWSADSTNVFMAREDEDHGLSYFQVDIATAKRISVPESTLPVIPSVPLPQGVRLQHMVQGGRYLYFQQEPNRGKTRIVAVRGLQSARH